MTDADAIDYSDPAAVATAAVEAIIAKDYDLITELTAISEKEHEELKREGATYAQMLEMLFEFPEEEAPGGKPLPVAMKELYTGSLDMRIGTVPEVGKIAVGIIGEVDDERTFVVIVIPYEEGVWKMQRLPKMMPTAKLSEIKS